MDRRGAGVIMVLTFPPPLYGMAAVYAVVRARLQEACAEPVVSRQLGLTNAKLIVVLRLAP